ncbi:DUF5309 domain-containing protein [Candidatus Dojkabacteria bacterium]|jgi:hypothetical protein|nr:DUF5309 domain-containing protein [Candidatus Dojkabacteria bacterium]
MEEQVMNQMRELLKVMDLTSGNAIIREDLSDILYEILVPQDTPLRNRFGRIKGEGKAHSWAKLTDIGMGAGWFANGQLPSSSNSTYVQTAAAYKAIGQLVQVLDIFEAAGKSYQGTSPMAREVRNKLIAAAGSEEQGILYGDSTIASTVVDAYWGGGTTTQYLQFDGLDKQITTNVVDATGLALSLAMLDDAMLLSFNSGGSTRAFVMAPQDMMKLAQLLFAKVQIIPSTSPNTIAAGMHVTEYFGPFGVADIIPHRKIVPASSGTQYTNVTSIYCLDDQTVLGGDSSGVPITMVDLLPMAVQDLARITTGETKVVWESSVLIVPGEPFQSKIINVKSTPTV